MIKLLESIAMAIGDLFKPMFFGHIVRSIFMTLGAIVVAIFASFILLYISADFISSIDMSGNSYLAPFIIKIHSSGISSYLSGIFFGILGSGILIGAFLFFLIFFTVIISLNSDTIATSIEKSSKITKGLGMAIKIVATIIFMNILLLPLYLFFPFLTPFIYICVNGYIFGRECFEMVDVRHMDTGQIKQWRSENLFVCILLGAIFMFMVPITNCEFNFTCGYGVNC